MFFWDLKHTMLKSLRFFTIMLSRPLPDAILLLAGYGCFAVDSKKPFDNAPVCNSNCQYNLAFKLSISYTDNVNNDIHYVFIFGNSGRVLDALKFRKNSVGVMIWAKAKQYNGKYLSYGFKMADFTE